MTGAPNVQFPRDCVVSISMRVRLPALAVKPDTPADDMKVAELERLEPSPANEKYYVLLFSSQSEPKRAKYTHSWSTVVAQ